MITTKVDLREIARLEKRLGRGLDGVKEAAFEITVNLSAFALSQVKQLVKKVTGSLARGWNLIPPEKKGGAVRGGIGTAVPYAAAVNWGKHAIEHVRAHNRRLDAYKNKTEKIRKKYAGTDGRVRHAIAYVRAHDRRANMPAQPYIEPAIARLTSASWKIVAGVIARFLKNVSNP